MVKRRQYSRFNIPQSIIARYQGERSVELRTHNIGAGGCYFDSPPPLEVRGGVDALSISMDGDTSYEFSSPAIFFRGSGFGFSWSIPPGEAERFQGQLEQKSGEPSLESKANFLIREQELLMTSIHQLEASKVKGLHFLFLLVAAYFALLTAPYDIITLSTNEETAFYAVAGIWASVMLIFHCNRYLSFLGKSLRRKVHLARAVSGNRAWFFVNDERYYVNALFPAGIKNDIRKSGSWDSSLKSKKQESTIEWIPYHRGTTFFFLFLEALFVFGLVHFLSLFLRAHAGGMSFAAGESPDVFSTAHFKEVFSISTGILFLWVQFLGNTCAHYQRAIWEARRIDPARPNPRFTGRALQYYSPYAFHSLRMCMRGFWVYGGLCLFGLSDKLPESGNFVSDNVRSFNTNVIVVFLFLVGKIVYWCLQASAEARADSDPSHKQGNPEAPIC